MEFIQCRAGRVALPESLTPAEKSARIAEAIALYGEPTKDAPGVADVVQLPGDQAAPVEEPAADD